MIVVSRPEPCDYLHVMEHEGIASWLHLSFWELLGVMKSKDCPDAIGFKRRHQTPAHLDRHQSTSVDLESNTSNTSVQFGFGPSSLCHYEERVAAMFMVYPSAPGP